MSFWWYLTYTSLQSTSQPAPASKPTAIPVPAIPASVPQPAVNQPAASIPAPAIVQPAAQLTTIIQMSTVVQPTTVLQMSTIVQPTTIVQMSTVVQPTTISQAGANIQPTPAVAGVPTVPISQTTAFQFQTGAVTLATPSASGQSSSGPKSGFKFEFKPTNVEAALLSGQSPSAAANAITSVGETGTVSGGIAALIVFGILGTSCFPLYYGGLLANLSRPPRILLPHHLGMQKPSPRQEDGNLGFESRY